MLDVSGSMFGYPLDTAKELIGNLVGNLRDSDQFNLILFSDTAFPWRQTVPAPQKTSGRPIDLIERQDGGGGTELAPALNRQSPFQGTRRWPEALSLSQTARCPMIVHIQPHKQES